MFDKSARPAPRSPVFFVPSFAPMRAAIWAILGLSAAGCGGNVVVGGEGGEGGEGGSTETVTQTTSQTGSSTITGTTTVTTTIPSTICTGAKMVLQANGTDSGFAQCPDGTIHRVYPVACDVSAPACDGSEDFTNCNSDADCTGAPNGKCAHYNGGGFEGGGTYCGCAYPCQTDNDCNGGVCVCAGVVPSDVGWSACAAAAFCKQNNDCPSGECGISSYEDGCGHDIELACRNAGDACRPDSDCDEGYQCVTAYGSNAWTCETYNCAIGRPLVVEGRARTAERASRGDWTMARFHPELASLSAEERSALAVYWHEVAALEHASIGSFARFTLELLALGAPADLLGEVQQATSDEIAHARAAYALASAYEGRDVGPGRLDMTGIAPSTDVRSIVTALVAEACVGETLGAAEARALAGMVSDPELAAVYARIADDEARHAELGWRTLSWLLRTRGDEVREVAQRAFDQAITAAGNDPEVCHGLAAPGRGLLSSKMLGTLRRQALSEVVAPCARGLFAQTETVTV